MAIYFDNTNFIPTINDNNQNFVWLKSYRTTAELITAFLPGQLGELQDVYKQSKNGVDIPSVSTFFTYGQFAGVIASTLSAGDKLLIPCSVPTDGVTSCLILSACQNAVGSNQGYNTLSQSQIVGIVPLLKQYYNIYEKRYEIPFSEKFPFEDPQTGDLLNISVLEFFQELLRNPLCYISLLRDGNVENDLFQFNMYGDLTFDFSEEVIRDASIGENPFVDYGNGAAQPLNALILRGYESIYNGFYRDTVNDPFILDGKPEYNKFITTDEDGADDTPYDFKYRDWEKDFLTTARPSPQQGIAPLVGLINRDPETVPGYSLSYVGEDGEARLLRLNVASDGTVKAIVDENYSLDVPVVKALNSAIDFGISINDLREVNSLQRWLEKNISRGYRYKDSILSHFGVDIRVNMLDMPEFCGGVSEFVNINTIYQTTPTTGDPLGSFAGVGTLMGASQHKVYQYCDEHGFIIGLMSVVPVPSYSQLLPKIWTKFSHFDYFFPEFNHIGFQPIPIKEIAPLQAFAQGDNLNRVFGYQRAWYEYLASTDEVHGDFRLSLRDFLINRVFSDVPALNGNFLHIDPAQVNDVFAVRSSSHDNFLGQIHFTVHAKRPISRYGEPRIE